MLTTRQLSILKSTITKQHATIKELASIHCLSTRMIRYEIDTINYVLKKIDKSQLLKKRGGEIYTDNQIELLDFISNSSNVVLTPKDRAVLFIVDLLDNTSIDIDEYCKQKNISRSIKMTTINSVKELLNQNSIKFSLHNNTITINDHEILIRNYLLYLCNFYKNEEEGIIASRLIFENQTIIVSFLQEILHESNTIISDDAFATIQHYINILLKRISKGYGITKVVNSYFLTQTSWYEIILSNITKLEKAFDIKISKEECLHLVDFFIGSSSLNTNFSYYDNWIELNKLVYQIILEVEQNIRINISTDIELFEELFNHIKSTIHRLQLGIYLSSDSYNEIIDTYPDLYYTVKDAIKPIQQFFNLTLNKNEIAFITIHFQTSINRINSYTSQKKQVLLVCSMGLGTSLFLAQQLQLYYDINIINTIPLQLLQNTLNQHKDIEYIVSTVALEQEKFDIPIIKINAFLKKEDFNCLDIEGIPRKKMPVYSLEKLINTIKKHATIHNEEQLTNDIINQFEQSIYDDRLVQDLFFSPKDIQFGEANTWQEAVKQGGAILKDNGCISSPYIDSIIDNISSLGSYMIDDGVAYPHSKPSPFVHKTGFSLLILDTPVIFPDDKEVSIVLTLSSVDGKEHTKLMTHLIKVLHTKEFKSIISTSNPQKIHNFLTDIYFK